MDTPKMNFLIPHLMKMQNLAKWPNTDVALSALVTELIPEMCQVPYYYLFRDDPVAMAECTLLVHEFLDIDILVANLDVYNFEAEAMGAKMNFYEKACPDFDRDEYFIKGREDFHKIKYTGLEAGRFPYLIEYTQAYLKYTGVPTFPSFSAPWTLAGNLYGLDNLVIATIEDPDFVHDLLNKIVDDYEIPMLEDLQKVLPFMSSLSLVDAFATVPMVNIDIIEEFIRPSLQRLYDGVCKGEKPMMDAAFFGHSRLNGEDRTKFEDFVVWAQGNYACMDPDVEVLTPEYVRRRANDYLLPLNIGMDAKLIEFGTKEEIINKVKHYTLAGKNGISPCICGFNNITAFSPVENIQTAVQAVKIYGAPGADENTPYVDPEFITFTDFLKKKMENNVEGYTFKWLEKSSLKDKL